MSRFIDPWKDYARATLVRLDARDEHGNLHEERKQVMIMGKVLNMSGSLRHTAIKVWYLPLIPELRDNQNSEVLWFDVMNSRFETKMFNDENRQVTKMYLE